MPLKIASTLMLSKNGWGKPLAFELVLSHPWNKITLVIAAVTQRVISPLDEL